MCDGEYDVLCEVWNEREITARVVHKCHACDEPIQPGHAYRRTATLVDRSWMTFQHCFRCATIIDALRPRLGSAFGTDTLALDCGEVWEDPPEAIAALAFALPGESICVARQGLTS